MRKLPIPFSDPMVRAILEGRKTQTRRILDPQPFADGYYDGKVFCDWVPSLAFNQPAYARFSADAVGGGAVRTEAITPRYAVGDLLWVRETYFQYGHWARVPHRLTRGGKQKWGFVPSHPAISFEMFGPYIKAMDRTNPTTPAWHKRLGRFMPRAASRITLRVTGVRVERLREINHIDARAEGIFARSATGDDPTSSQWTWQKDSWRYDTPREAFQALWESINGPGSWDANPWVAAYSFEPILQNVDKVKA